jgi:SNF2 family DNA or RNA helicase
LNFQTKYNIFLFLSQGKTMDLKEIRQFAQSSVIYERGLDYFRNNKVKKIFIDANGAITAKVSGSSYSSYNVVIAPNPRKSSYCDCPAYQSYGICKHIIAVLITQHMRSSTSSKPKIGFREHKIPSPLLKGTEHFKPQETLPAQTLQITSTNLAENTYSSPFASGKYTPAFIITLSDPDMQSALQGWTIKPGLQSIKKNGEQGRILPFSKNKLLVGINEDTRKIMDCFSSIDFYPILLQDMAPLLFPQKNIHYGLTTPGSSRISEISLEEMTSLEIGFIPGTGTHEEDKLFAQLTARIGTQSVVCNIQHESRNLSIQPSLFCILDHNNEKVLYKFIPVSLFGILLSLLPSRSSGFDKETTSKILGKINSLNLDWLKIRTTIPRKRDLWPVPKPILELETDRHSDLLVHLFFSYENHEFSFSDYHKEKSIASDSEIVIIHRSPQYEKQVYQYVQSVISPKDRHDFYFYEPPEFFTLSDSSIASFLMKFGQTLIKEGFKIRMQGSQNAISGNANLKFKLKSGIDWFDVHISAKDENEESGDIDLDPSLLSQGIVSSKGKFYFVSSNEIEILKQILDSNTSNVGLRLAKSDIASLAALKGRSEGADEAVEKASEIFKKISNLKKIEHIQPDPKFKATLRDYQLGGLDWLHFLREFELNGCLADDMGLGKTIQTLALLSYVKHKKRLGLVVIVCPVTTLSNWNRETSRFAPHFKTVLHTGQSRNEDAKFLAKYDIVFVSYHILRNDIEIFRQLKIDTLVLDEAHNIKNHYTEIFKAVRSIEAKHRLTLTGTPVENNILELWALMDFLNPGLLGSREWFQRRFRKAVEIEHDKTATERLRRTISPFILRRKKEDVLKDLPEKQEITLYSEMNKRQAAVYETHKAYFKEKIKKSIETVGLTKSSMEILTALLRMRQIALFPELVDKKFKDVESGKFEQFIDLIEEVLSENHKVLVFSQFTEALSIIRRHLDQTRQSYSYLDGSMTAKKRQQEIDKFQTEKSTSLFLLSLKAGGVGITLTEADYVVIFDPWWNPAAEMQAIDRCCRIGQTKKVFAYKLITKGTVEEKILALQEKKKKLVENLITTEEGIYKSLNKEDVLGLFE